MSTWLRRIRGAIGLGAVWALGWAPIGAVYMTVVAALAGIPLSWPAAAWMGAKALGAWGFVGGALFSGVLGVTERNRRFEELTLSRFGLLGAVGAMVMMVPFLLLQASGHGLQLEYLVMTGIVGTLGSGSAMCTLALARAGSDRALEAGDPPPLAADSAVDSVGLSPRERRELLGEG